MIANVLHACRAVAGTLDGLMFGRRCYLCNEGELTMTAGDGAAAGLCADCWLAAEGERIEAPFCAVCSAPCDGAIVGHGEFICGNCRGRRFAFTRVYTARRSRGVVHSAVVRFKYRGDYGLRGVLAPWLGEALTLARQDAPGSPPDALVPVPLHPASRRARGFNQAEVLAHLVGKSGNMTVLGNALRRVRHTQNQMRLDRDARQSNLRDAFRVARPEEVRGRRLLLVDDVFTTGATAHECARTLRAAGAVEVAVIVVARR